MNSAFVISMGFAMVAIVLLAFAVWAVIAGQRQTTWTRVPGRVIRSQVVYRGEEFAADVLYSYQHDCVEHTGSSVSFPQIVYNWRGPAERICMRYPQGAAILVYLDPQDPKRSVLEPPSGTGALALLLASVLFLVLAWAIK